MEAEIGTPVENLSATEPNTDLNNQISALQRKNTELIGERRRDRERMEQLQQQLEEIQAAQTQQQQQKLAESGEFKKLWEDAQETIRSLQSQIGDRDRQIDQLRQEFSAQTLKQAAVAAMSRAGALAPEQLYRLVETDLSERDGKPMAIRGGVELPLEDYLQTLRAPNSGFEHHFAPSGRSGMGTAVGRPATPGTPGDNPFRKGSEWNLTKQLVLMSENPEMAELLRREAAN